MRPNVTIEGNNPTDPSAFIFFISRYEPGESNLCSDQAIEIQSNVGSVLFYATEGCISINPVGSALVKGALIGEEVYVSNNVDIEFDPALSLAEFGLTRSGGWFITSYKEK